jgi:hypothetical protein
MRHDEYEALPEEINETEDGFEVSISIPTDEDVADALGLGKCSQPLMSCSETLAPDGSGC